MPLEYTQPVIKEGTYKPVAFSNKSFPYEAIGDRRFEELLYSIGKLRIEKGDWNGQFDEINLLQGVRERGRDCSLHLGGKSIGLIQCKHSINSTKRISKPECAREIIKFVLHYLLDNHLIHDPKNFTYWFAVSYGFNEQAKDLLDDFNVEIIKQKDLQDWTEKVIDANEELRHLKYLDIETDLKEVLKLITVKKIIPQDLDTLLNSTGFQSIIKTFFEIRMVVESESVEDLAEELKKRNEYQPTSIIPIDTILQKFDHASHHLVDYADTFEGIDDSHIERRETNDILRWIRSPLGEKEAPVVLLVGGAGCGKTVILKDVYLKLKETDIPVIGLKADRYYAESITDLQNKIDLEDSFEKVVRTLSQVSERVVILIDQIDALSQSLSAKREYLDAYNLLVRKLITIDRVRVIISVRAYDLDYDSELKFYKNQKSFKVGLLEQEQVMSVLAKLKIREAEVPIELFHLLRIPHHLNVFCKIYDAQTNLRSITTLHDLYDSLWAQQVVKIPNTSRASVEKCQDLIFAVAEQMYRQQKISTSAQPFLIEFTDEMEYLKSCNIVSVVNEEIHFFHQTFFDFAFAKQFVQNGRSITIYLKENHQGLFIRSSLKMIIGFLREQNHKAYLKSLDTIFFSKQYRFHIKLMFLNLLGFEETPTSEEIQLVKSKILQHKELKQPFMESVNSSGWLDYLIESGELQKLLTIDNYWYDKLLSKDWLGAKKVNALFKRWIKYQSLQERWDEKVNTLFQILVRQLPKKRKTVCEFLLYCPEFDGKQRFVFRVLYHLKKWDIQEAFQLFEKYEIEARQDRFGYYNTLEDALSFDVDWVIQKYKCHCLERIEAIKSVSDKPSFEYDDEELIKKIFENDGEKGFDLALTLVKEILDKTSGKNKSTLYTDLGFLWFDYERGGHSHGYKAIYHFLVDKVQEMAKQTLPQFDQFFLDHKDSNSITILRLLFFGFLANPSHYVMEIFQFMKIFHKKGGLVGDGKIQFQFRQLLEKVYPYFDDVQKSFIDNVILSLKPEYEQGIYQDDSGKKSSKLKWYGRTKFLYLNAIPRSELDNRPLLKKVFQELERKFQTVVDKEPYKFGVHGVGPPMTSSAYDKMTFEQWESSFEKYNAQYTPDFTSPEGSILEHSRAFQAEVKNRATHFFPFIEKLIDENKIPYQYIVYGLKGLTEAKYIPNEVQRIYKKALPICFDREHTLYFVWIASYFIETKVLDVEVLEFLVKTATTHSDPKGNTILNDVLNDGANNVRGAAAGNISRVYFNPAFENIVFEALHKITEDSNLSVRVSIMPRLAILMHLNEKKTLDIFLKLVSTNEPEIMKHSIWSVQYLVNNNFDKLRDYFLRAIRAESIQGQIGVVLGIAWLNEIKGSQKLLRSVLKLSDEAKAKVVDMAVKNLGDKKESVRRKCKEIFLMFLNSSNEKVIHEYSCTFLDLTPEIFLEVFPLLQKYSHSNVAKRGPHYYFQYLIKCAKKHPKECLELLLQVNTYDKPDITQVGHYDNEPIKVLIGIYNSLSSLETKDMESLNKSIELFDDMLKNPKFRGAANKVLDQVEK